MTTLKQSPHTMGHGCSATRATHTQCNRIRVHADVCVAPKCYQYTKDICFYIAHTAMLTCAPKKPTHIDIIYNIVHTTSLTLTGDSFLGSTG